MSLCQSIKGVPQGVQLRPHRVCGVDDEDECWGGWGESQEAKKGVVTKGSTYEGEIVLAGL